MAARSAGNDSKWEEVKSKDDRRKKSKQTPIKVLPAQQQASRAFAAIDSEDKSRAQTRAAATPGAGSPSAFAWLETDSPPQSPVAPREEAKQSTGKPASNAKSTPSKQSKVKKPVAKRVSPAETASRIDLDQFRELLQDVQSKYKTDHLYQLETLADYFVKAFKECELSFFKDLRSTPIFQAADIPVKDLPKAGVPDAKGGQQKMQVGVLVMLSLLLRAVPAALLHTSDQLLSKGSHFCSPVSHLDLTLWAFAQASRSNPGVALAMWLRVLLPILMGAPMSHPGPHKEPSAANPSQNNGSTASWVPDANLNQAGIDTSLQFLGDVLARDQGSKQKGSKGAPAVSAKLLEAAHAGIATEASSGRTIEPVVPSFAVEAMLALAGIKSGGFQLTDATYLGAAFPGTAAAWTSRHKYQLRGSARVLFCWLARVNEPAIRTLQRTLRCRSTSAT
ncbi:hypothetical protein WJX73_002214 [Symbiochloris irregularis]|uniref:Uncharacterized protein n=1 Tax=Symbiochloris irregularis TaxID=706552 RepID=A0AAW1PUB3_9CHLO